MTTIAAVRTPDGHVLACDTQATDNTGRIWPVRSKLLVLGDPGDHTIVGLTGHRMIRHALEALGPPPWTAGSLADPDRAIRVWVEQLADSLRDRHVPTCDDGLVDAAHLVAHGGDLWYCTDGLAERYVGGITAIGSGGDLALGYLEACETNGLLAGNAARAAFHLTHAIAATSRHDTGTGGEVDVLELAGGQARDPHQPET